jgi:predicted deacylase
MNIDRKLLDSGIKVYTADSKKAEGKTLALTGAVHGDEKCGPAAIRRIMSRLHSGQIEMLSGKLLIIPVANPEARKQDQRMVNEWNLNRGLYHREQHEIKLPEHRIGNDICDVLDRSTHLLDIHSYAAGGPPFLFIGGNDKKEMEFGEAFNSITRCVVWNWDQAFPPKEEPKYSWGLANYMRHHGKPGITIECGQHNNPHVRDVAYAAILRGMAHLGMIDAETERREMEAVVLPPPGPERYAKMIPASAIFNEKGNPTRLAREFRHFGPIAQGEILAERKNGEIVSATANGYAIFPKPGAQPGTEMMYVAVKERPTPITSTPYPQPAR